MASADATATRGRSRRGGDRKWWSPSSFEPAPLYRPWWAGDLDDRVRAAADGARAWRPATATSRRREIEVPIDTLRHVLDVLGPPPEPDAPPPVYLLREGQDPWRQTVPRRPSCALDAAASAAAAGRAAGPAAARPALPRAAGSRGPLIVAPRTAHRAGRPPGVGARGAAVRGASGRELGHRRPRRPRARCPRHGRSGVRPALAAPRAGAASRPCSRARTTRRRGGRGTRSTSPSSSCRRSRRWTPPSAPSSRARAEGRALTDLPLIDRDAVLRREGGGAADRLPPRRSAARRRQVRGLHGDRAAAWR